MFTCIHNYRKLALNPSKLKRFFYLFRLSCQKRIRPRPQESSSREKSPADTWKQEISQPREVLADKEQQVSRAMRSRHTQTKETLSLTLTLLSPTGATLKESKLKSASWEEELRKQEEEAEESCWRKKRASKAAAGQRGREEAWALSSSWLESRKSLIKSCFDRNRRSRSSQMKMRPFRSWDTWGTLQLQLRCSFVISLKAEGDGNFGRRKRSEQPV